MRFVFAQLSGWPVILAHFQDALLGYAWLAVILIGPFLLFAATIHFLERIVQKRLAERFGWKSVLWTGWLGTPVHELSHAAMCVLFRHRIDAISLFEPDLQSGRLGYVRHSWRKGNWFEELGNFFIGIAPLIGGSITLLMLLRLFFPNVFDVDPLELGAVAPSFAWFLKNTFSELFRPESFFSFRFWIFVYLVLCVGSHMAPSRSDYQGAFKGTVMVVVGLVAGIMILAVAVPDWESFQSGMFQAVTPLFVLLLAVAALCIMATAMVWFFVGYFPQRFRVEP